MKSNNNISMNAFSKTNVNKRRKKKTKPKQRQYKKNKVYKKRKKAKKKKKVKKNNIMANFLKILENMYPDHNIRKLNDSIRLTSLLSEREITSIMSGLIDIDTIEKYKCYFKRSKSKKDEGTNLLCRSIRENLKNPVQAPDGKYIEWDYMFRLLGNRRPNDPALQAIFPEVKGNMTKAKWKTFKNNILKQYKAIPDECKLKIELYGKGNQKITFVDKVIDVLENFPNKNKYKKAQTGGNLSNAQANLIQVLPENTTKYKNFELVWAKQAKHDNYIGKEKAVKIGASTVTIYYDDYDGAEMLGIFPQIQNKAERKAKIKDLKKQLKKKYKQLGIPPNFQEGRNEERKNRHINE